jgi:murein DD-endopeptidase
LQGIPYRPGGADPAGFDCSGFVWYVFAQHGVILPRAVREQYQAGRPVDPESVAPGDLLFFSTAVGGATHVAIAIGGHQFVHAPSSRGHVRIEQLASAYWAKFLGARRVANQ